MLLPRRALGSTGLHLSALGFGASPLGSVFATIDEDEGVQAVHEAVRLGINFFDCSPFYGATRAETVLGRALKDIPRDQFILSTKVGRYGQADFDFSAERVRRSVEESLSRLQVQHIDIVQCHDIEFGDLDQVVRYIGITGLPLCVFKRVLDAAPAGAVDCVLSYCHYNLLDTALASMLPYLQEKDVGIISASPLAMGLFTRQGPPTWHPAPQEVQSACQRAVKLCDERGACALPCPYKVLATVAESAREDARARGAGEDVARLAIAFAVAEERIATTLVGMCTRDEVRRNVAWTLAALEGKGAGDAGLLSEVQKVLQPVKDTTWPSGRPENSS